MIKIAVWVICCSLYSFVACAQEEDFCYALTTILRDAKNQFRNTRQNVTEVNASATIFRAGIHLPGAIKCRFVASMGLFYEAALVQTTDSTKVGELFKAYKLKLDSCMLPQSYHISKSKYFTKELSAYQKIAYMPDMEKVQTLKDLPGHITLEIDYMPKSRLYTVLLFIFEH